jgi:integrase
VWTRLGPAGGGWATYAERWLAKRSDLRPTTRSKYESLLRRHIVPALGHYGLGKLKPADVRDWCHSVARDHQSTAEGAYRALRAIVNTAVADGDLAKSPCTVRGPGGMKAPERPTASAAEVTAAAEATPERYRVAILLAAWCQLRRGEVLGLQRQDVDLLHGTVRIERARVVTPAGEAITGPPKTAAGSRTLNVPANVLHGLEEHLDRFVKPGREAWLFANEGGSPLLARYLNRAWDKARLAIERSDLHLHDLRHSGLTWSAATGASVAELMCRGGHANPQAALRYQHATEDRDKALADALAGLASTPKASIRKLG